jgi:kynureninase
MYLIEYLTPKNPSERGSQLSIRFSKNVALVFEELEKHGVVVRIKKLYYY